MWVNIIVSPKIMDIDLYIYSFMMLINMQIGMNVSVPSSFCAT